MTRLTPVDVDLLRRSLLRWYDRARRDLPWRSEPGSPTDPYRVWLSEVMLQQTRVETVRPYYERWLGRFPDLPTLAAADPDDVLKAWEGLGYYSRARNFHRAVREVVDRYGGRVPSDPRTFRALPGVGRYIAGAVMSIAFGQEEPIVDGNVRRVFARLLDDAEPREGDLWSLAACVVRGSRPGDLNQALMELGATVCTPRSASCAHCPIRPLCASHAAGTVPWRPARRAATVLPTEQHGVAVVQHEGMLLLVRRPDHGRLGGLWEFPGVERAGTESAADAARRAVRQSAGLDVEVDAPIGTVPHAFTHVRVVYEAFAARLREPADANELPASAVWVEDGCLGRFALPRAQQRIATLVRSRETLR